MTRWARMVAMSWGISKTVNARPVQAALASAASFATGAAMPLLVAALAPATALIPLAADTSLASLALLGGLAARAGNGGTRRRLGAVRNSRMNKVPPTVHFETEAVVRRHCDICSW